MSSEGYKVKVCQVWRSLVKGIWSFSTSHRKLRFKSPAPLRHYSTKHVWIREIGCSSAIISYQRKTSSEWVSEIVIQSVCLSVVSSALSLKPNRRKTWEAPEPHQCECYPQELLLEESRPEDTFRVLTRSLTPTEHTIRSSHMTKRSWGQEVILLKHCITTAAAQRSIQHWQALYECTVIIDRLYINVLWSLTTLY